MSDRHNIADAHHGVSSTIIMIMLNHARFSGKTPDGGMITGDLSWRETLARVGNQLRREEGEVTIQTTSGW